MCGGGGGELRGCGDHRERAVARGHRLSLHSRAGGRFGQRRRGAVLLPPIERIAQTGSTNADLLARLASGEHVGEGHWLVADRQTAGRGRLGRAWGDGLGNFMGSTVVHLTAGDPSPAGLSLVAGVALAKAVATLAPNVEARLKWPNDLLIDGVKCTGILLERAGDSIVIGMGVNLVSAPELRSEEHTSELQSLMRISYAVFCLQKKT